MFITILVFLRFFVFPLRSQYGTDGQTDGRATGQRDGQDP